MKLLVLVQYLLVLIIAHPRPTPAKQQPSRPLSSLPTPPNPEVDSICVFVAFGEELCYSALADDGRDVMELEVECG